MADKPNQAIYTLTDLTRTLDVREYPFLHFLPQLLQTPQLAGINPSHAVSFTEYALKHDSLPIVKDAMQILNRIIDPVDGNLLPVAPDIFYGNRSFFWKELGGHTKVSDVVLHIFNKTVFVLSMGKKEFS